MIRKGEEPDRKRMRRGGSDPKHLAVRPEASTPPRKPEENNAGITHTEVKIKITAKITGPKTEVSYQTQRSIAGSK